MATFNANVFFFMYACGKQISASTPNLARQNSDRDEEVNTLSRQGFGFVPLDYSSTYGSTLSLNSPSSFKPEKSPRIMMTSHCVSPIPHLKPRRKPKRYKTPRCFKCKRPGHFAFHCKTSI